ncbi:hypothetical protein GGR57DRAFT_501841 [Xylariaceae sp. FL1272]|nr:hypothetical protein GGR57DRAFT_501841 [Xylariaceae sp. FL1272]
MSGQQSTGASNMTGSASAAGPAAAAPSNRRSYGAGACSECGKQVKNLNQHHKNSHIGNVCQWPVGNTDANGDPIRCGRTINDEKEMWAHLVDDHQAIIHHAGKWWCEWPDEEWSYDNRRSAERLVRFKHHDAFHGN